MNEATTHLEDSIKEAQQTRKRQCCILLIVIIAAIVLVSLIPFIFRVCLYACEGLMDCDWFMGVRVYWSEVNAWV